MNIRKNKLYREKGISSAILQINIDDIRPNRAQPRLDFDTNSIIRLADSIRRYGILQPLSVRRSSDEGYKYELIAGERRLRAARSLGYLSVPCIIIEADEKMSAELAIIENLLREDLNMFEQAYGFRQLIDNYSMTQEEIARKVSLSQSAVANKLRLLRLSYEEQRKIIEYELTERHARALLRVKGAQNRLEIIDHIHSYNLNVYDTEQYIEGLENASSKPLVHKNVPDVYFFDSEKVANDVIGAINKKIEALKRAGNDANVTFFASDDSIEVIVRISKQRTPSEVQVASLQA